MNNLNFGQAIESLKNGKMVARKGWNGKGMYLYLQKGKINAAYVVEEEAAGEPLHEYIDGIKASLFEPLMGDAVTIIPNICMRTATGSIVNGWLASQTDILAEDWTIVE